MSVWTPPSSMTQLVSGGQTRQQRSKPSTSYIRNPAWVVPRRRLGGVICFLPVFLLAMIPGIIFWLRFCFGHRGDDTQSPETAHK